MNLTALTLVTKPEERQDPWRESLASVLDWADEVIVVCGDPSDEPLIRNHFTDTNKIIFVHLFWPEEWSWEELPKHLNAGLREAHGDWLIRFDIDYVFPDDFGKRVRDALAQIADMRIATFQKFSCVAGNRFYQKGGVPLGLNLGFKSEMAFGEATNKETDLCYPIIVEGTNSKGIPCGKFPEELMGRTGLSFFNYDYTFKTMEFTAKEFFRFSKAYERFFGTTFWGHSEDESLAKFINMQKTRYPKCRYKFPASSQPRWIMKKVKELTPEQFGYDGWGLL